MFRVSSAPQLCSEVFQSIETAAQQLLRPRSQSVTPVGIYQRTYVFIVSLKPNVTRPTPLPPSPKPIPTNVTVIPMSIRATTSYAEGHDFMHSSSYDLCVARSKTPPASSNPQPDPAQGDDFKDSSSFDLTQPSTYVPTPSRQPQYCEAQDFMDGDNFGSTQQTEALKAHKSAASTFTDSFTFSPVDDRTGDELFC
jgi:hypothetical protein